MVGWTLHIVHGMVEAEALPEIAGWRTEDWSGTIENEDLRPQ